MAWYQNKGFEENPFNFDTLNSLYSLRGRDEEAKELLYRIASGHMMVIEGIRGSGLTMMLKHAIDNFKGVGKVIYSDAENLDPKTNISSFVRKKPKGMILLLDNVHTISRENLIRLKHFYDEDQISSVVFTTQSYADANFTDAIRDRIGKNHMIITPNVSEDDAFEILKDRIGRRKELLSSAAIKNIYNESESVKEFLKKAEKKLEEEYA